MRRSAEKLLASIATDYLNALTQKTNVSCHAAILKAQRVVKTCAIVEDVTTLLQKQYGTDVLPVCNDTHERLVMFLKYRLPFIDDFSLSKDILINVADKHDVLQSAEHVLCVLNIPEGSLEKIFEVGRKLVNMEVFETTNLDVNSVLEAIVNIPTAMGMLQQVLDESCENNMTRETRECGLRVVQRNHVFEEELILKTWHPSRLAQTGQLDDWNMN